jgi:hypothetical protein
MRPQLDIRTKSDNQLVSMLNYSGHFKNLCMSFQDLSVHPQLAPNRTISSYRLTNAGTNDLAWGEARTDRRESKQQIADPTSKPTGIQAKKDERR